MKKTNKQKRFEAKHWRWYSSRYCSKFTKAYPYYNIVTRRFDIAAFRKQVLAIFKKADSCEFPASQRGSRCWSTSGCVSFDYTDMTFKPIGSGITKNR